jgi:intracellular sulfur oxidation DsrE/DsrF family protein
MIFKKSTFSHDCARVKRTEDGPMDNLAKSLFAFAALIFLLAGCGVKEGAEFYTLQKEHNQLQNSVSNLQVQVKELMAENNSLRIELATNSQAVNLLIQDERKHELEFQKLLKQASNNSDTGQTVERK